MNQPTVFAALSILSTELTIKFFILNSISRLTTQKGF